MQTIYRAEMDAPLVSDLAHDFPHVFAIDGHYWLEIRDWDAAMRLTGSVVVCDNEDGTFVEVDGWRYPLTEA